MNALSVDLLAQRRGTALAGRFHPYGSAVLGGRHAPDQSGLLHTVHQAGDAAAGEGEVIGETASPGCRQGRTSVGGPGRAWSPRRVAAPTRLCPLPPAEPRPRLARTCPLGAFTAAFAEFTGRLKDNLSFPPPDLRGSDAQLTAPRRHAGQHEIMLLTSLCSTTEEDA